MGERTKYNPRITWRQILLQILTPSYHPWSYHDKPNHKTIQEFRKITPKIWFVCYIAWLTYRFPGLCYYFFMIKLLQLSWKRWSTHTWICAPFSFVVCFFMKWEHAKMIFLIYELWNIHMFENIFLKIHCHRLFISVVS